MTDAQLAVIASLVGVFVGFVGTMVATAIQQRAENKRTQQRLRDDRRKEHADLVAKFSAAEMKSWGSAKVLHYWLKAYNSGSDAYQAHKWPKLEDLLNSGAKLSDDLMEHYALIRILVPSLADAASELIETRHALTGYGDITVHTTAHDAALEKFEDQARELLEA